MTHIIAHQYDEILPAAMPGLEIHVIYNCTSEISYNEECDEENNRLLTISATVNGLPNALPCKFPEQKDGRDAQYFLARLRESAQQALWAEALRQADGDKWAAERWCRTGSVKLTVSIGKAEPFYG